jgi:hypothetical protein
VTDRLAARGERTGLVAQPGQDGPCWLPCGGRVKALKRGAGQKKAPTCVPRSLCTQQVALAC